jgi:signal transduction histidine kinase
MTAVTYLDALRALVTDQLVRLIVPLAANLVIFCLVLRMRRRLLRETRLLQRKAIDAEARAAAIQNANQMKSDFLTTMSHEMRTPMAGILSFAEMAMKTELTQVQREYLDRVLTSAEWLTHVLSDVLDFSRLEACRLDLEMDEFSIATCIASATKMVEGAASRKNLDLSWRVNSDIPAVVRGDSTRLRQVIVNLLDNAVRFTTSGSVMLNAVLEAETESGITLAISVADTGIGIAPERQTQIFEPFNGSSRTTNDRTGGTGLGLSICRRLVTMMGGNMEVQSHPGAGSTFRFSAQLEKVRATVTTPETAAILSKLTKHRLSVLVADENALERRLVTKLLESAGHQVAPASTTKHALELFGMELFDMVLLSAELPDMDVDVLAAQLRQLEEDSTRACVYALRSADTIGAQTSGENVDGWHFKPIGAEDLLRIVDEVGSARVVLH